MSATHFITVSGRVVDIFAPAAQDISFDDIAEHLSKEARYNGGTPGKFYSVAQHLCLGADWVIAEATGQHADIGTEDFPHGAALLDAGPETKLLAAYVLAHDFHEYLLKDETTPKKKALEQVAQEFGAAAGIIHDAFGRLIERHDRAIHAAAGLPWPPPIEMRPLIETIDKRLLLTEWAALHKGHKLLGDYSAYEPLPIQVEPWGWPYAAELLATRMAALLPACRKGLGLR